ncbi:AAA family ATPase [Amycolatopsis sp. NPDC051128]|uniref:AAA family ATPase n=1 Tax=Amycolatopsis sp. NPDC051128 TaxID=3155412 RepID=UPI00342F3846
MSGYRSGLDHLADELERLDLLIAARLAVTIRQNEVTPHGQAARTVYITREEVDWLLAVDPGTEPPADREAVDLLTAEIDRRVHDSEDVELPLVALGRLFDLSTVELGAVLVCLAPELRRKYDRLYAYLQDDITRIRPSVDLVLQLLCEDERDRWLAGRAFTGNAPLLRHGILDVVEDPQSPSGSSGLARLLTLDPRIMRFLLGENEPDARLAGHAEVEHPAGPPELVDPEAGDRMFRLVSRHPERVWYLSGPAGAGTRELARHTAHRLGHALVSVDLRTLTGPDAAQVLRIAFREALLQDAAVYVAHADEAGPLLTTLAGVVAGHSRPVFLSGKPDRPEPGLGVPLHPVAVPWPGAEHSESLWRHSLSGHTADAAGWAAELAGRYRLPPARIRAAVRLADEERAAEPEPRPLTLPDVAAACRRQSGRLLGEHAVKVTIRRGWDDLVLPADRIALLREIGDQVRHRHRVLNGWGFGAKLGGATGLAALFSGPPGTGKTMAAEVIAHELGVDLYKVDLSGVISKYVGETEKNLARIFAEMSTSNAILFFDEADALFGKRTEVSDAHDRYANIETSYLLQKVEEYEGVVVLATNLRQNIDDAFTRRIRFVVEFPFPDAADRQRIWGALFPPAAPLSADVDFAHLAGEFPVTGANIRNIVVNAAFFAAADGGTITAPHILRGARREFDKIGKLWPELVTGEGP